MADLKLPRINKAMIAGRIVNDLELKFTPKGTPVLKFRVAVDRPFKDDSDQWQQSTSFIDVVLWSERAERLANNAHKGSAVIVEGRIETRSYTDNNNINRTAFEIIADNVQTLEWKPKDGEAAPEDAPLPEEEPHAASQTKDDVPF